MARQFRKKKRLLAYKYSSLLFLLPEKCENNTIDIKRNSAIFSDYYLRDMTYRQVAEKYNISSARVGQILVNIQRMLEKEVRKINCYTPPNHFGLNSCFHNPLKSQYLNTVVSTMQLALTLES